MPHIIIIMLDHNFVYCTSAMICYGTLTAFLAVFHFITCKKIPLSKSSEAFLAA